MRVTNLRGKGLKLVPASGGDNTRDFSIIDGGQGYEEHLEQFLEESIGTDRAG